MYSYSPAFVHLERAEIQYVHFSAGRTFKSRE